MKTTKQWTINRAGTPIVIRMEHDPAQDFIDVSIDDRPVIIRATRLLDGSIVNRFTIFGDPATVIVRANGRSFSYDFNLQAPAHVQVSAARGNGVAELTPLSQFNASGNHNGTFMGFAKRLATLIRRVVIAGAVIACVAAFSFWAYTNYGQWPVYQNTASSYEVRFPPGVVRTLPAPVYPGIEYLTVSTSTTSVLYEGAAWSVDRFTFATDDQAQSAYEATLKWVRSLPGLSNSRAATINGVAGWAYDTDVESEGCTTRLLQAGASVYALVYRGKGHPSAKQEYMFFDSFKALPLVVASVPQ